MSDAHRVEVGQFGWACSCGKGREWPLAPVSRARTAALAHQAAETGKAERAAGQAPRPR